MGQLYSDNREKTWCISGAKLEYACKEQKRKQSHQSLEPAKAGMSHQQDC
jgi:hypothetical protein